MKIKQLEQLCLKRRQDQEDRVKEDRVEDRVRSCIVHFFILSYVDHLIL
ncbi:MAG: hypothetical protein U1D70_14390 [Methylobacter sp.]|nr:hypothetical protein [Methylobacter sp.]MDP2429553.1 hypothetical protein [Methylobacter sp.]MDP3056766.1 hypothetical protein [Methylobacter sp.]MDP3360669.1 hypothetical protein [Methylobacter sp.]MDZ4220195.1 hypothetical protein [Methylobacter sp.]